MSHWKGCFKLAILVGLGLKWNRISKDKKCLEGAEKDELTHPAPGSTGNWSGILMGRDGVQPDHRETSQAWVSPARELQKNSQWEESWLMELPEMRKEGGGSNT